MYVRVMSRGAIYADTAETVSRSRRYDVARYGTSLTQTDMTLGI